MDEDELRKRVRERIEKLGVSDSEIGRIAGISKSNLSRWLSGDKSFTIPTLARLLAAVGLSLMVEEKGRKDGR